MAYADLATIQDTDPGDILTAAWCDQARDNDEFFIDPPACSVYASSGQTLTSTTGTPTALTADSEFYDNDSMHSTSTNTDRITINTAGRYQFFACVEFQADADGARFVEFMHNGTTRYFVEQIPPAGATLETIISGSRSIVCAVNDYVVVRARHNAGNNLSVELNEFSARFITR